MVDFIYEVDGGDWNMINGKWYHLLMTHTAANVVNLWVNGTNQTGSASASTASTVGTTFGNRTSESFQALDGSMDELVIVSEVVSDANVQVLYQAGSVTKP